MNKEIYREKASALFDDIANCESCPARAECERQQELDCIDILTNYVETCSAPAKTSRPDRTMYKRLCADCADKLGRLSYSLSEINESGDKITVCQLCENRGYFSTYVVYSKLSEREEE